MSAREDFIDVVVLVVRLAAILALALAVLP